MTPSFGSALRISRVSRPGSIGSESGLKQASTSFCQEALTSLIELHQSSRFGAECLVSLAIANRSSATAATSPTIPSATG